MANSRAVTSPYQQLYYNAFKLEFDTGKAGRPQGTGFLFEFDIYENGGLICLVTAGHCVPAIGTVKFSLPTRTADDLVDIDQRLEFEVAASAFLRHPDSSVDLAIALLGPQINMYVQRGAWPHLQSWSLAGVHPVQDLAALDWVERLYFVGCPSGWYDDVNFLPVVRRATTATPIHINYKGRSEFLIDAHVFKGSSGSPVILVDQDRDWVKLPNDKWHGRTALLGILVRSIEDRLGSEIGLGECVRADRLLDFIPLLVEKSGHENLKSRWVTAQEDTHG
ncbi:MAG: hypothetical protein ACI9YM_001954 [Brevundimonas sp.]|jgi:hypothetical protein|uniref:trypsin-like peptidase domain-containing protein n=1 Tax=Brevundimonas sp. TaxID=1871086 RepID=UPI0039E23383